MILGTFEFWFICVGIITSKPMENFAENLYLANESYLCKLYILSECCVKFVLNMLDLDDCTYFIPGWHWTVSISKIVE